MIAGRICYHVYVFLISRFAVVITSDGAAEVNYFWALLLSGVLFAVVLYLGWRFFRGMTKKELFLSASIMVVFALCVDAAYNAVSINGLLSSVHFSLPVGNFAWCEFVPSLLMRLTGAVWLGHISFLMPYVFVLFGKKKLEEAAE